MRSFASDLTDGRAPVALVALDRLLSRRINALLAGAGVAVRDETGWKLSTTRAAAQLLALLRAAAPDAGTDAVLDALKQCPRWPEAEVDVLERDWRRSEVARWAEVLASPERRERLPQGCAEVLAALAAARPLWGNGPEVLRAVRDPVRLSESLRAAGFAAPLAAVRRPKSDGRRWLALHSWIKGKVGYPAGARNFFVVRLDFENGIPVVS